MSKFSEKDIERQERDALIARGKQRLYETMEASLLRLLDDAVFSVEAQARSGAIDSDEMKEEMLADVYEDYAALHDYLLYTVRRPEPQPDGTDEVH